MSTMLVLGFGIEAVILIILAIHLTVIEDRKTDSHAL